MTLSALRRPRAFWISVFNLIGLACSMVGVVLLFWFALPNEPPGGPAVLGVRGGGPAWEAHRITEELVDNKVLLKDIYFEADQAAVPSIEKRTSDHWSGRGSMTAVLFLSLGLCAVLWETVGWLASAVSW
jgi:hypothetical protein